MKALVLAYDESRSVTDHMLARYQSEWPNHPFTFHIPCQITSDSNSEKRNYIHSLPDIKSTIFSLLEGLDDEEWIYWCVDDKYPIAFNLDRIKQISSWVTTIADNEISGILFCRCRKLLKSEYLTGQTMKDDQGLVYLERKGYEQIWIHQYLRVKVIRHMFSQFPDVISAAQDMDDFKAQIEKPRDHRLFVTQDNYAVFGESTKEGQLTQNCYESLIENNIAPSEGSTSIDHSIIMGEL